MSTELPAFPLNGLYAAGSLARDGDGFQFTLANRITDAVVTRVVRIQVDGAEVPLGDLTIDFGDGVVRPAPEVTPEHPERLPRQRAARVRAAHRALADGAHDIHIEVDTEPFGALALSVRDALGTVPAPHDGVPYDKDPAVDYTAEMAARRRRYVEQRTGARLQHVGSFSFDAAEAVGHIESFAGVAQVPIGIAGPLRIHGEHADGDFLIPLATSEATLVASYNRGMKVLNLSGGVTCTVSGDCMQRAPVFIFDSAREARAFRDWVDAHIADIRREAEATSHVAKLLYIETYLANKFAFLRFDFSTGDAGGQNMVGRATFAACRWIVGQVPTIRRYYLESNFATDKKGSYVNLMRTRGKRVTAEAVLPREVMREHLRVVPEDLHAHGDVANIGVLLSGASNNGLHAANAITAMFIATGQDVANVAEGAAGMIYSEITPIGDLYLSITVPSLIVATHGGGTSLPTQRECLAMLGCTGPGTALKLAEIVAGVVLAGEISLAGAISAVEWVSAHDKYTRAH